MAGVYKIEQNDSGKWTVISLNEELAHSSKISEQFDSKEAAHKFFKRICPGHSYMSVKEFNELARNSMKNPPL